MKTALIYHAGDSFTEEGLKRWLGSFSDVAGIIVIVEPKRRMWKRIRKEWDRGGFLGMLDVLAMRVYYRLALAASDRAWENAAVARLRERFPALPTEPPILVTASPNTPESEAFMRKHAPDLVVARCKTLIKRSLFSIPPHGIFVMHPGICPDYRNAHGCFWALANGDSENVGMTLLRIDDGIDTGPIFGHFRCNFDAARDSHILIQNKLVIDNLDGLQRKLLEVASGLACPVDTTGRPSREWGQPRLSAYLRWRRAARRSS